MAGGPFGKWMLVRPQAAAEPREDGKASPKAYLGQTRKLLRLALEISQAR